MADVMADVVVEAVGAAQGGLLGLAVTMPVETVQKTQVWAMYLVGRRCSPTLWLASCLPICCLRGPPSPGTRSSSRAARCTGRPAKSRGAWGRGARNRCAAGARGRRRGIVQGCARALLYGRVGEVSLLHGVHAG